MNQEERRFPRNRKAERVDHRPYERYCVTEEQIFFQPEPFGAKLLPVNETLGSGQAVGVGDDAPASFFRYVLRSALE